MLIYAPPLFLSAMEPGMLLSGQHLKVLRRVVRLVIIEMVHLLTGLKATAIRLFPDNPMLQYVPIIGRFRMLGFVDADVSAGGHDATLHLVVDVPLKEAPGVTKVMSVLRDRAPGYLGALSATALTKAGGRNPISGRADAPRRGPAPVAMSNDVLGAIVALGSAVWQWLSAATGTHRINGSNGFLGTMARAITTPATLLKTTSAGTIHSV